MYLIQLMLPLYDNGGTPLPSRHYAATRAELVERFGGLTAYTRAPASGLWKPPGSAIVRDELVVLEVMTEELDRKWWKTYREQLETRFAQDAVVVRAHAVTLL